MRDLTDSIERSHAHGSAGTGAPVELAQLVATYAGHLEEQAAVLASLPGGLQTENCAEAAAYRAVVHDLSRLLKGELPLQSLAS